MKLQLVLGTGSVDEGGLEGMHGQIVVEAHASGASRHYSPVPIYLPFNDCYDRDLRVSSLVSLRPQI